MTLITDRPEGLASSNELDNIPADLLGPIPAEIRLGQSVLMMMDQPPEVRDVITVVMRLRVKDKGEGEAGEGGEEIVHYRRCKILAAWLAGERPDTDADQGPLFEVTEDGKPVDESGTGDEPEALGDILEGVDRPAFSNLTGGDE